MLEKPGAFGKVTKLLAICLSIVLVGSFQPWTNVFADEGSSEIGGLRLEGVEDEPPHNSGVSGMEPNDPPAFESEGASGGGSDSEKSSGALLGEDSSADEVTHDLEDSLEDESDDATTVLAAKETSSALEEEREDTVQSYAGTTIFETAAAEAKSAYPEGSPSAILVGPGVSWIDALSAAGLAASKGPILFTERQYLHSATAKVLTDLGVKSVVVVGGSAAVSDEVIADLSQQSISLEVRLGGADCYGTQMEVYNYGVKKGLWGTSLAILATGTSFADALSISPVAYDKKAPIFLVDESAGLPSGQKQALVQAARSKSFLSFVIVGGSSVVSERAEGFLSGVVYTSGSSYCRLAGVTGYDTSAKVAQWAVDSQGFSWDKLAFTTGKAPYDALAGSVLQGSDRSVMLLIDEGKTAAVSTARKYKKDIKHVRFFGGTAVVPSKLRDFIISELDIEIKPDEEKPAAPVKDPLDKDVLEEDQLKGNEGERDEQELLKPPPLPSERPLGEVAGVRRGDTVLEPGPGGLRLREGVGIAEVRFNCYRTALWS